MRRALLLSLIILLSQPFVSATDITADSEEDSSGTLSGTYTVSNGATWTVSGDYEIAENTSLYTELGYLNLASFDGDSGEEFDSINSFVVSAGLRFSF